MKRKRKKERKNNIGKGDRRARRFKNIERTGRDESRKELVKVL